ncbi:hypothetical protein BC01_185 [Bacillus phage BC01]|nr:hypothetical protein BC01_185 [Bacillus phage BC01]
MLIPHLLTIQSSLPLSVCSSTCKCCNKSSSFSANILSISACTFSSKAAITASNRISIRPWLASIKLVSSSAMLRKACPTSSRVTYFSLPSSCNRSSPSPS